ncbi:hypothetical protein OsI_38202 [Oryza sativa Indica Group]|uniref:Uncharacterized protein n=1 Tax=Oryza sativa subsp. indica TaxID=39946 RepID=B8BPG0_ORYSI|nr:hypothetical protein OsI_38202 [Oryza sativa Indica Group]
MEPSPIGGGGSASGISEPGAARPPPGHPLDVSGSGWAVARLHHHAVRPDGRPLHAPPVAAAGHFTGHGRPVPSPLTASTAAWRRRGGGEHPSWLALAATAGHGRGETSMRARAGRIGGGRRFGRKKAEWAEGGDISTCRRAQAPSPLDMF